MADIFDEITAEFDKPAAEAQFMMDSRRETKADSGLGDVFKLITTLQDRQGKQAAREATIALREAQQTKLDASNATLLQAKNDRDAIRANPRGFADKIAAANGFKTYAEADLRVKQLAWDTAQGIFDKDALGWSVFSSGLEYPTKNKKTESDNQTIRQLLVDPVVGAGVGAVKGVGSLFGLAEIAASNAAGEPTFLGDVAASTNKYATMAGNALQSDATNKTRAKIDSALAKGSEGGVEEAFKALVANPAYMAQFVTEQAGQFLVPGGIIGKAGSALATGAKASAGALGAAESAAALSAKIMDWAATATKTGNLGERLAGRVISGVASNSALAAKAGLIEAGGTATETQQKAKDYLTAEGIDPNSVQGRQFILQAQNQAAAYAGTVGAATTLVLPGAEGLLSKVASRTGRAELAQAATDVAGRGVAKATGMGALKIAGTAGTEAAQEFAVSPAEQFGLAKAKGVDPTLREIWNMGNPVEALLGAVGGAGTRIAVNAATTAGRLAGRGANADTALQAPDPAAGLREATDQQVNSVVGTLFSTKEGNDLLTQLDAAPGASRDALAKQAQRRLRDQVINEFQVRPEWNSLPTMAAKKAVLRGIEDQIDMQFTAAAAMAVPEFKAQIADLVQSGVTFSLVEGGTEITIKDTEASSPVLDSAFKVIKAEFGGDAIPYERVRAPGYRDYLIGKIKADTKDTYINEKVTPADTEALEAASYEQTKSAYEDALDPARPTTKSLDARLLEGVRDLDGLYTRSQKAELKPAERGRKRALQELLAPQLRREGDLDPKTFAALTTAINRAFTRGENVSSAVVDQAARMRGLQPEAADPQALANEQRQAEYERTKAAYEDALDPARPTTKSLNALLMEAAKDLDSLYTRGQKAELKPAERGRKQALQELLVPQFRREGDLDPKTFAALTTAMNRSFTRGENVSSAVVDQVARMRELQPEVTDGQALANRERQAEYERTKTAYQRAMAPNRPTSKSPAQRTDDAAKILDGLVAKDLRTPLSPQEEGRLVALNEMLQDEYSNQGDLAPNVLASMTKAQNAGFTRGQNISKAAAEQIARMKALAPTEVENEAALNDTAQPQAVATKATPKAEAATAVTEQSIAAVEADAKAVLANPESEPSIRALVAKSITDAQLKYLITEAKDIPRANALASLRNALALKEGGAKPAAPKLGKAEAQAERQRRFELKNSRTTNSGSLLISDVRREIEEYFGEGSALRLPNVKIIQSGADAPRASGKSVVSSQAFYEPRTKEIFLIADNMRPGTAVAVLMHEFGHKNLDAAVGAMGIEQIRLGLSRWKDAYPTTDERQIYDKAMELATIAAEVVTKNAVKIRRDVQLDELIPYAIELASLRGIAPDAKAPKNTVAKWLADVERKFTAAVQSLFSDSTPVLTVQDLVNLANGLAAVEFESSGKAGSDAGRVRFSVDYMTAKRISETNRAVFAQKTATGRVKATVQKVSELKDLRGAYARGGALWLQRSFLNAIDLRSIAYAWRGLFTVAGKNILQTPVDIANERSAKIRVAITAFDEKVVFGGKSLVKLYQDNQGATALWQTMDTATVIQYDPSAKAPANAEQVTLKREYDALTAEQKAIYKATLDSFRDQWKRTVAVLKQQVVESGVSAAEAQKITAALSQSGLSVYFAQQRFGKYVNLVKDGKGNLLFFSRHESNGDAERAKAQLDAEFKSAIGVVVSSGMFEEQTRRELDGATQGYISAVSRGLNGKGIYSKDQIDAIESLMAEALIKLKINTTNASMQRRKNVAGASPDGFRANIAALRQGEARVYTIQYQRQIQEAVQKIRDYVRDPQSPLQDQERKIAQQVSSHFAETLTYRAETGWLATASDALTTYGFIHTMWGNVSSAIINATSLITNGAPTLGARFGYKNAAEQMYKATMEVTGFLTRSAAQRNLLPTGDLKRVFDYAKEMSMIQYGDARDVYDISSGAGIGSGYFSKAVKLGAFPLEKSEEFTNLSILLSAYRMARGKGADEQTALQQARDARWLINPDNSSENKSLWARTPVGKVLMQLKGYGIGMSTMLYADSRDTVAAVRASLRGEVVSEESKIAAKRLAGVIGMHAILSGLAGVPFLVATPMLALAYALAGGFSDEEDLPMSDYLKNVISEAYGESAMRQVFSGMLGEGVSSRISLNNLLFDTKGNAAPAKEVDVFYKKLLGPAFGGIWGGTSSAAKIYAGEANAFDALKTTLPAAVANVAKSYELYTDDGMASSKAGNPLLREPLTNAQMLGQMIGLRPADLAFARDKESAIKNETSAMDSKRRLILGMYRDIILTSKETNDDSAVELYTLAKDVFNKRYPDSPIDAAAEKSAKKRALKAHDEYLISQSDKKHAQVAGRLKWAFAE